MPIYLDTRGKTNLGIGICDRCRRKFPIEKLQPDRNTPGLLVCEEDNDVFDPWRLPARQSEDITLPHYRPDVPLGVTPTPEVIEGEYRITEDDEYRITEATPDEYRITEGGVSVDGEIFATNSLLDLRAGILTYRRRSNRQSELLTDLSAFAPPAAVDPWNFAGVVRYYVDPVTGSNANTGLSWAQAFATVNFALTRINTDVVIVRSGIYRLDAAGSPQGMATYSGNRNIVLATEAPGSKAYFTTAETVVWGLHSPETYSGPVLGTPLRVVDMTRLNPVGAFLELTEQASIAAVEATPDSWIVSGGMIYVHLSGGAIPSQYTLPLVQTNQRIASAGIQFYARDICFIGGNAGALDLRSGDTNTIVTTVDCDFQHNMDSNGLTALDIGLYIGINCRALSNFNDGFNYHENLGLSPHFLEINCLGAGNLASGDGQGSSAHESCHGFRLNGLYRANHGPGIADVQLAKSWNVTCLSTQNFSTPSSGGYTFRDSVEAWSDACEAYGNTGSDMLLQNVCILHVRDSGFATGISNPGGSATITSDFD